MLHRLLTLTLLLSISVCLADTLLGRVIRVLDGDTVELLTAQRENIRIRLNAIAAPEKSQAYGQRSRRYLNDLVHGRNVQVQYTSKDRYGRILGDIYLGEELINLKMVEAGLAWHYVMFAKGNTLMAKAEAEARAAKRGLWQEPNPIPPWEFRKNSRDRQSEAMK
ncbi:MAG: thermonuclease family protein [Victivallales bacterium]|nr:thermonuclease family protein [Victivallales bacterium]